MTSRRKHPGLDLVKAGPESYKDICDWSSGGSVSSARGMHFSRLAHEQCDDLYSREQRTERVSGRSREESVQYV